MTSPLTIARPECRPAPGLRFVFHPSFELPGAEEQYGPGQGGDAEFPAGFMPEEVTIAGARSMHYAAYRRARAVSPKARQYWVTEYFARRNGVVLGNRGLVYRAVGQRLPAYAVPDAVSDCHLVLIRVAALYNPWLGVRFSTYAFTCLLREATRLARGLRADWLARSVRLELQPNGAPHARTAEATPGAGTREVEEYFRDGHPLLTAREKKVLTRRFGLGGREGRETLGQVGREVGLSRERVRQIQAGALGKLRGALHG